MKRFKRIDFRIQLIIFITALLYAFSGGFNFIFSYFSVAVVQVTSAIVHFVYKEKFAADEHRFYYNWLVFWVFVVAGICFAFSILILFLYPLMLVSPLIAVWYLVICEQELSISKSIIVPDQNTLYEK